MSFETALRARLKVAPGLGGVSVEWSRRKQYPAVVLTTASFQLGRHMVGFDRWQRPRLQIDVFALDALTKVALRDAVIAAIAPAGLVDGIRFGRAIEVRHTDMSQETDTDFVFRDMIEAVLPHIVEN